MKGQFEFIFPSYFKNVRELLPEEERRTGRLGVCNPGMVVRVGIASLISHINFNKQLYDWVSLSNIRLLINTRNVISYQVIDKNKTINKRTFKSK